MSDSENDWFILARTESFPQDKPVMASIPGDFLQIGVYNAMQALCWSQVRFDKGYDSISNDTCPIIYHLHSISRYLAVFYMHVRKARK